LRMSQTSSASEFIYSTLGGDPDLGEIVTLFTEEMPARIATLRNQSSARDWAALRRSAHQLKGSAGSYGFDPISPCAAVVEDAVRNGEDEQRILAAVQSLIDMCGRIRPGVPQ
jgi:histidine phosphotransfer protein HptB